MQVNDLPLDGRPRQPRRGAARVISRLASRLSEAANQPLGACQDAGLLFDPKGELDPDAVYVQIVQPGVVKLPTEFKLDPRPRAGCGAGDRGPVLRRALRLSGRIFAGLVMRAPARGRRPA